jgi:uncharacterized protein YdaU (DUF1376 family)
VHYYKFNISDFRAGTHAMSELARWVYRDMLDIYYDTEKPLPLDPESLFDAMGAETEDRKAVIERILRAKFTKTENGYVHAICDAVIADYHANAARAKANGKRGGRPKKAAMRSAYDAILPSDR